MVPLSRLLPMHSAESVPWNSRRLYRRDLLIVISKEFGPNLKRFLCFLFFFFREGGSWGGFEDDYKGDVRVIQ